MTQLDLQQRLEHAEAERDTLQQQVDALAMLAEDRRVFIVNGTEMGYIQLPVFQDDPATATYERCLLKPEELTNEKV